MVDLIKRIGIDLQAKMPLEQAIDWAIKHQVSYIDAELDIAPNAFERFDAATCAHIRALCDQHGIHLGLHTLSSVNTAEISPFVSAAVDAYLEGYIDLSARLGAEWIVVHGGFHFGDQERRLKAAVERLARVSKHAERAGAKLLLENLNWEPDRAEVHYIPHSLEQCRYFFEQLDSPNLGWSFTINHATLEPEGIVGFLQALPTERLGEVRLADNNGEYELHMFPGDGIIDFQDTFARIEGLGYTGHYMCNFGTPEDMLRGRQIMAEAARATALN
ncbi:MAG: sugar phosphate isomerase/epimerase [Candidatus Competibacteraceae bacterium]|nr:sugar phosphate isomerase/epimerase [Candidatus Competibacteraceae bacterium]MCB1804841.1 sugar phosphate isomerase/epimerase [Candidatus Competibacteraceae bacterium]MCB1813797.1 sugar phosphate isomerase/epimerase [Candidatus Competibacteraceae bacterium]